MAANCLASKFEQLNEILGSTSTISRVRDRDSNIYDENSTPEQQTRTHGIKLWDEVEHLVVNRCQS
jgi:hypothetical protein